jgi:hypothetical protein
MRTHHAHLAMGVRVDMPFFALNSNVESEGNGFATGSAPTPQQQTLYYVPVSLEARLTF